MQQVIANLTAKVERLEGENAALHQQLTVHGAVSADHFSGSRYRIGGTDHRITHYTVAWRDVYLIDDYDGRNTRGSGISGGRSGLLLCNAEYSDNAAYSTAQLYIYNADYHAMSIQPVLVKDGSSYNSLVGGNIPSQLMMRIVRITNGNKQLCLADGSTVEGTDPATQCSDATTTTGPPPYKIQASTDAGYDSWVRCVALDA